MTDQLNRSQESSLLPEPRNGQTWYQIGFELAMGQLTVNRPRTTDALFKHILTIDDVDLAEFNDGLDDGHLHYAIVQLEQQIRRVADKKERITIAQSFITATENVLENNK